MVDLDFAAEILCDSIAPNGSRLTTMQVTFPRFVLAEFNTHRRLSRNAASSRAIPVSKRIEWVNEHPVLPVEWGVNRSGMQASELLDFNTESFARSAWLTARDACLEAAQKLADLRVHKQIANRVIETWAWITVVVSATEWSNFFGLRCDLQAQPELQKAAYLMRDEYLNMVDIDEPTPEMVRLAHLMQDAYEKSIPKYAQAGEWSMPYITEEDRAELAAHYQDILLKVSVARCARVSYLTQSGIRDVERDIELYNRLLKSGHWSPFEHVAQAMEVTDNNSQSGNLFGWRQYRKMFADEELR